MYEDEFSQITYGRPYFHPYQFFIRRIRSLGPYGDINRRKEIKAAKSRNAIWNKTHKIDDKRNKTIWSEIIFLSEQMLQECMHTIYLANYPETVQYITNNGGNWSDLKSILKWQDVDIDIFELLKQQMAIVENTCHIDINNHDHIRRYWWTKTFIAKIEKNNGKT